MQCDDDGTVERGIGSLSSIRNDSTRRSLTDLSVSLTLHQNLQPHLRHSTYKTTLEPYIKSIPESLRVAAVESLDHLLKSSPGTDQVGKAN